MVCESCQHANPDTFRFCGNCGQALDCVPAKVAVATKPSVIAVSGPSILGLGDDPSNDADYLLDDEPSSRSRGPIFLTLLFLAFLAGTGYFYWQRVYAPSMRVQVPALRSTPPPAFAYERTDPLVLANSQLATTTGLLDRSSLDHVRLQRIAADIKEEADAADPRKNPNLVEGEKYLYGRGVSQDCKQAIEHFKAAAKQDNAPALTHLGVMSASGRCMKRDRVQAYKWFAQAKAADPGNVWLDQSMDMLWANMSHSERTAVLK